MQAIQAPINPGDAGSEVANLQAVIRLLSKDGAGIVPDTGRPPTRQELDILTGKLESEQAEQFFGAATETLLTYFRQQRGLDGPAMGSVDERTAKVLNDWLKSHGLLDEVLVCSIKGTVKDSNGNILPNLHIEAFDQDLRVAEPLGKAITDSRGEYVIRYTAEHFARAEKETADIVIRVRDPDGRELLRSPRFRPDGVDAIYHPVIPVDFLSEWMKIAGEIEPLLIGQGPDRATLSPLDLNDDDIRFIAEETGLDAERLRLWVLAAKAGRDTVLLGDAATEDAIESAVFFGWFRDGLPTAFAELILLPVDDLLASFFRAIERNIMPPTLLAYAEALKSGLRKRAVGSVLQPAELGPASLGDLLGTLPGEHQISDTLKPGIAEVWIDHPKRDEKFWQRLDGAGLTAPQVNALKSTIALNELTTGEVPLVRTLQRYMPAEPDGSLVHLAELAPNDWIESVAEAQPEATLNQLEITAYQLAGRIERTYPSQTFKQQVRNGAIQIAGFPATKIVGFLEEHEAFSLRDTDVEPYLIERGLENDTELKGALLRTQRVLRLGASHSEAAVLMNAASDSILSILPQGKAEFIATHSDKIPEHRLAAIYDNGQVLFSGILGAATAYTPFFNPLSIPAVPGPNNSPAALKRFPSLQALFGDLSYCACKHCNSVLGPPAYLVELLQVLEKNQVLNTLRVRRPDITELELTCENTNTELPHVDLVLEVLENASTFPGTPVALAPTEMAALDAKQVPATLRAELEKHASGLDDDFQVEIRTEQLLFQGAPQWLIVRNGSRRWTASRWRQRLSWTPVITGLSFFVGEDIPPADRDAVLQDLRNGQVSTGLLAILAAEPKAPVNGIPTVATIPLNNTPTDEGSEAWTVTVERELVVEMLLSPGAPAVLLLSRADGTTLEMHEINSNALAEGIISTLELGHLPAYVGNLLPNFAYRVRADGTNRWRLSATTQFTLRYDPDRLVLAGLTYTASNSARDLTVFAENRNPEAYRRLGGAIYPWELPFDVFTEEVRACLTILGVPRRDLLRTVKPANTYRTLEDVAETFATTPAQLNLVIESPADDARRAALWGLQERGNALVDPLGDVAADPVPSDWVGALGRLSVLLDRSRLTMSSLMAVLATQYLRALTPQPVLDPPFECKPSRVTLTHLGPAHLDGLQRFLRMRKITGWAIRDLDAVISAVTDTGNRPLDAHALTAAANLHELSERLGLPLRYLAAWVGPFETAAYRDYEAEGTPLRPSLYAEVFQKPRPGQTSDSDFALDATVGELAGVAKKLTELVQANDISVSVRAAVAPNLPADLPFAIVPGSIGQFAVRLTQPLLTPQDETSAFESLARALTTIRITNAQRPVGQLKQQWEALKKQNLTTLSAKRTDLGAALQANSSDLASLIGPGTQPVIADQLRLDNLLALYRQVTLARALGLSVPECLLLQSFGGVDLFPGTDIDVVERTCRLIDFVDTVKFVGTSGFSLDEIAYCVASSQADELSLAQHRLDQLQWLRELQDKLRTVTEGADAGSSEQALRAAFSAAGWPSTLVDRLIQGEADQLGLSSTQDIAVTVTGSASAQPIIPSELPFVGLGQSVVRLSVPLLTPQAETEAFEKLQLNSELGSLSDPSSPAAELLRLWNEFKTLASPFDIAVTVTEAAARTIPPDLPFSIEPGAAGQSVVRLTVAFSTNEGAENAFKRLGDESELGSLSDPGSPAAQLSEQWHDLEDSFSKRKIAVTVLALTQPSLPPELPFKVRLGQFVVRLKSSNVEAEAFDVLAQVPDLGPITDPTSPAARLRTKWGDFKNTTKKLAHWLQSLDLPKLTMPLHFELEGPLSAAGAPPLATPPLPTNLKGSITLNPAGSVAINGFLSEIDVQKLAHWIDELWPAQATNTATVKAALDTVKGPPATLGSPTSPLTYDSGRRELVLAGYPTRQDIERSKELVANPQYVSAVQTLATAAESYVEQRGGSRLLSEAAVLDLLVQPLTLEVPGNSPDHRDGGFSICLSSRSHWRSVMRGFRQRW